MADVKINDLSLAETVLSSMQLETDIAGATGNKITLDQLRDFILDVVTAAIIPVENSSFKVLTGDNSQSLWVENDTALLNARTTGIRYGGIATVNGGTGVGNTIDITAGAGQILNNQDAENPSFLSVVWTGKTALPLTTTNPNITYWYIDDNSDTVKQTTSTPTREDYRTRVYLVRTAYTADENAITGTSSIASPLQQEGLSIRDLAVTLAPLRADGLVVQSSGANLKILISSGGIFDYGSNYDANYTDPHVTTFDTFDSGVDGEFRYVLPSGPIAQDLTDIQVGNYAPAGVVTAIPGAGTRVGMHFVYRFGGAAGNVRIVYGDEYYNNAADAAAALAIIDPLSLAPASFSNAFLLGVILAEKSETNLANATFLKSNTFGEL